jgi:dTMP kinase
MFITLEGPEGSGKSSQLPPLADYLRQNGFDVLTTREPGGTVIGNQVRTTLMDLKNSGMSKRTEILLFLAARAQLVDEVIRPHLAAGGLVLCDRYADSTLAYQGYGQGGDLDTLRRLLHFATGGLKPDLTVLLDLDVRKGLERRRSGGDWNRLDAFPVDVHERVRRGYLEMAAAEPDRWVIVDAGRKWDEVQEALRQVVMKKI